MQIVGLIILLETFILYTILTQKSKAPIWIKNLLLKIPDNRFGMILVGVNLKKLPEDVTELVENVQTETPDNVTYEKFCNIIDWISLIVIVIIFIFMYIAIFPRGYLSFNYDPIESIS